MTTDDVRVYQAPPVTASTSHGDVTPSRGDIWWPDTDPCWCQPPLAQHSIHALRHNLYFRDDVTEVTPGDKGVTYIQVRVIDWLDLYTGQSDWLTWPIFRSDWLIDTWRYLLLATWRPMAELPGWRHTVTSQRRHLVTSPEVRHITWHLLDQSDRWKTYRIRCFNLLCILLKLLEIIIEFGLQIMVNDPTRIESDNILDLIPTSNPSIITNTHTTPGMSDHEAVIFEVNLNPIRNRKPPHKVFKYKSADWCKLKNEISKLTDEYFDTDPNSQDVNTNWTFLRDNLTTLMNNTMPHGNTKAKPHLPWISLELIRMQRRRNKSHKKAKQTGLNKHWEQFRELSRNTTKALATSYKSYVKNQIDDSLKTNPKRCWSFMKANKRENIGIPSLRVNDKPITNDRDKANALNNQFPSVFTSERYPLPVIDPSVYSSMPPLDIGTNGIIKQLTNLNQNKATGPDEFLRKPQNK